MSEPNASAPGEDDDADLEAGDELQFDQAEYATPAPAGPNCGVCKRPIDDAYYEINGKVVCATCRQQVEAAFRGGSRVARLIKALVFGAAAGIVGAVLYYAIIRMTGLNIGLVAVVVGLMVGGAVRKGSGNRGGLFYQLLAVFLTYSAIVVMHVPMLIEAFVEHGGKQAQLVPEKAGKDLANVDEKHKPRVIEGHAKVNGEPERPVIAANEPAQPGAGGAPSLPAGAAKRDPAQVSSKRSARSKAKTRTPSKRQRSPTRRNRARTWRCSFSWSS